MLFAELIYHFWRRAWSDGLFVSGTRALALASHRHIIDEVYTTLNRHRRQQYREKERKPNGETTDKERAALKVKRNERRTLFCHQLVPPITTTTTIKTATAFRLFVSSWMSGDKKYTRWRPDPILIEENITVNSTTTRHCCGIEEQKHTENIRRHWLPNDETSYDRRAAAMPPANERLSQKIDRILRKIYAWTNEKSTSDTSQIDGGFFHNKHYDNLPAETDVNSCHDEQHLAFVRRRCCSSTQTDRTTCDLEHTSASRPFSMEFVDRSLLRTAGTRSSYHPGQTRKVSEPLIVSHD
jgi:hypothetical protein